MKRYNRRLEYIDKSKDIKSRVLLQYEAEVVLSANICVKQRVSFEQRQRSFGRCEIKLKLDLCFWSVDQAKGEDGAGAVIGQEAEFIDT